jgi:hypothetical protein
MSEAIEKNCEEVQCVLVKKLFYNENLGKLVEAADDIFYFFRLDLGIHSLSICGILSLSVGFSLYLGISFHH